MHEIDIRPGTPEFDRAMMRRALQLARLGEGNTHTNPMVGAVITAEDGRIIGEGYHRQFGGPHAEVNAVRSVAPEDLPLLAESTVYVTLEPCSHYGKTPPCAHMLVEKGVRRVVVGAGDPFPKVSGRGISILRQAGIEVTEGVLREECEYLNRRFMTAHRLGRPWVQLKWAQTEDGRMAADGSTEPLKISTPLSTVWMHRQRSLAQGILAGTNTLLLDRPSLTCRYWPGKDPVPLVFGSRRLGNADIPALQRPHIVLEGNASLRPQLERLYREEGVLAIMVEGGEKVLESFLNEGLADEIRREIAPALPAAATQSENVKNT